MSKGYCNWVCFFPILLPILSLEEVYVIMKVVVKGETFPWIVLLLLLLSFLIEFIYGILILAPFFIVLSKRKEERGDYREMHAIILRTSALIKKITMVPFLILLIVIFVPIVSEFQKVVGVSSILLALCMIPFAALGSLAAIYFPAVGIAVFSLIFFAVLGTSLVGILAEVEQLCSKRERMKFPIIRVLFLCVPFSDLLCLLIFRRGGKTEYFDVKYGICVLALIIGLISTIGISYKCNIENSFMNQIEQQIEV